MNKHKTQITSRLVALSLACALTLPNPAFALRTENSQSAKVKAGLEEAFQSGDSEKLKLAGTALMPAPAPAPATPAPASNTQKLPLATGAEEQPADSEHPDYSDQWLRELLPSARWKDGRSRTRTSGYPNELQKVRSETWSDAPATGLEELIPPGDSRPRLYSVDQDLVLELGYCSAVRVLAISSSLIEIVPEQQTKVAVGQERGIQAAAADQSLEIGRESSGDTNRLIIVGDSAVSRLHVSITLVDQPDGSQQIQVKNLSRINSLKVSTVPVPHSTVPSTGNPEQKILQELLQKKTRAQLPDWLNGHDGLAIDAELVQQHRAREMLDGAELEFRRIQTEFPQETLGDLEPAELADLQDRLSGLKRTLPVALDVGKQDNPRFTQLLRGIEALNASAKQHLRNLQLQEFGVPVLNLIGLMNGTLVIDWRNPAIYPISPAMARYVLSPAAAKYREATELELLLEKYNDLFVDEGSRVELTRAHNDLMGDPRKLSHLQWLAGKVQARDTIRMSVGGTNTLIRVSWIRNGRVGYEVLTGLSQWPNEISRRALEETIRNGQASFVSPAGLEEVGVMATLRSSTPIVQDIAFTPNGKIISGGGHQIYFWDPEITRQPLNHPSFNRHPGLVVKFALSPDGRTLASIGSSRNDIYLWNATTGEKLGTLTGGHSEKVTSLAFSPDGQTLASGSADKTIRLWDIKSRTPGLTLKGHTEWVWSLAFSPDGNKLVSGGGDHTVRLWNLPEGRLLQVFTGHKSRVSSVAFTPDGKNIASGGTGVGDNLIYLWTLDGKRIRVYTGHKNSVTSIAFSPDGKILASASRDTSVILWDVDSGHSLAALDRNELMSGDGHTQPVKSVAFSPDGRTLASAGEDSLILLWDIASMTTRRRPPPSLRIPPAAGLEEETVEEKVRPLLSLFAMGNKESREGAKAAIRGIGLVAIDPLLSALQTRPTRTEARWARPRGAALALAALGDQIPTQQRPKVVSALQGVLSIQQIRTILKIDYRLEGHPHTWLTWVLPAVIQALRQIDPGTASKAILELTKATVREKGLISTVVDEAIKNADAAQSTGLEETSAEQMKVWLIEQLRARSKSLKRRNLFRELPGSDDTTTVFALGSLLDEVIVRLEVVGETLSVSVGRNAEHFPTFSTAFESGVVNDLLKRAQKRFGGSWDPRITTAGKMNQYHFLRTYTWSPVAPAAKSSTVGSGEWTPQEKQFMNALMTLVAQVETSLSQRRLIDPFKGRILDAYAEALGWIYRIDAHPSFKSQITDVLATLVVTAVENHFFPPQDAPEVLRRMIERLSLQMEQEPNVEDTLKGIRHYHMASLYFNQQNFPKFLEHWGISTKLVPRELIEVGLKPAFSLVQEEITRRSPGTLPDEQRTQLSAQVWVETILRAKASHRVLDYFFSKSNESNQRYLCFPIYQILQNSGDPLYPSLVELIRDAMGEADTSSMKGIIAFAKTGEIRMAITRALTGTVQGHPELSASVQKYLTQLQTSTGLEESSSWRARLRDATHQWQIKNWIFDESSFFDAFSKPRVIAEREWTRLYENRKKSSETPGMRTLSNRPKTLEAFTLLAQAVSPVDPTKSLARLIQAKGDQEVSVQVSSENNVFHLHLEFFNGDERSSIIRISVQRKDHQGMFKTIGTLRIGKDQIPANSIEEILHLDLTDGTKRRSWRGHIPLTRAWSSSNDPQEILASFQKFQGTFHEYLLHLPSAEQIPSHPTTGLEEGTEKEIARWEEELRRLDAHATGMHMAETGMPIPAGLHRSLARRRAEIVGKIGELTASRSQSSPPTLTAGLEEADRQSTASLKEATESLHRALSIDFRRARADFLYRSAKALDTLWSTSLGRERFNGELTVLHEKLARIRTIRKGMLGNRFPIRDDVVRQSTGFLLLAQSQTQEEVLRGSIREFQEHLLEFQKQWKQALPVTPPLRTKLFSARLSGLEELDPRKVRIYSVEDEPQTQKMMKRVFSRALANSGIIANPDPNVQDSQLRVYGTLEETLADMEAHREEGLSFIVFTDMNLTERREEEGLQVIQKVKAIDPNARVVVISTPTREQKEQIDRLLGPKDELIYKPVDSSEVQQAIQRHILDRLPKVVPPAAGLEEAKKRLTEAVRSFESQAQEQFSRFHGDALKDLEHGKLRNWDGGNRVFSLKVAAHTLPDVLRGVIERGNFEKGGATLKAPIEEIQRLRKEVGETIRNKRPTEHKEAELMIPAGEVEAYQEWLNNLESELDTLRRQFEQETAGLEEQYIDRLKRMVRRELNVYIYRRYSRGSSLNVEFDSPIKQHPQWALVKEAGDWWIHLHLNEGIDPRNPWRGEIHQGLLFRLKTSLEGKILGLIDPMAEPHFLGTDTLDGFVPIGSLVSKAFQKRLTQAAVKTVEPTREILEGAMSNDKAIFMLGRAVLPKDARGVYQMIRRKDFKSKDEVYKFGLRYREAGSISAGLEERSLLDSDQVRTDLRAELKRIDSIAGVTYGYDAPLSMIQRLHLKFRVLNDTETLLRDLFSAHYEVMREHLKGKHATITDSQLQSLEQLNQNPIWGKWRTDWLRVRLLGDLGIAYLLHAQAPTQQQEDLHRAIDYLGQAIPMAKDFHGYIPPLFQAAAAEAATRQLQTGLEEPQAIWAGLEEQWIGLRSRSVSDKMGWVVIGEKVARQFPELPPLAGLEEHIVIAKKDPTETALYLAEHGVSSVHLFAGLEETKHLTAVLNPLGISAIPHNPGDSSFQLLLPEILSSLGIPREAASAGLEEFSRQLQEFGEAA